MKPSTRNRDDESSQHQASQYARSLIEAGLDPLVAISPEGKITDYPLTIRHRNRRLTEVLYNASVYKDASGHVLGVFAAARDVTAQKRAEAEIADRRSKELERPAELERFQKLTVGRELKMIELKKEIEELKKGLGKE
jgi:hypothetical protein